MRIYNTLSKNKEEFLPTGSKIRMFVCGPTVYYFIHIGNARTFVFFDVVAKYLRFRGYSLEYIQSLTDIEDKIIERAFQNSKSPAEWAKQFDKEFQKDMSSLGVTSVNRWGRSTEHIPEIIDQVERLLKKGNAYVIEGDGIYFDLTTFPDYGKLAGRTVQMAEDGVSRIDDSPNKRNKGDFAIWKFSKPGEPSWPFGSAQGGDYAGRPGWHIEDTAVTEKYFGPQYELHGAAVDLIFPHHEAEIAIQESLSGLKPFVCYWMHAAFLINKEEKMSKSLGNFMTAREALERFSPEALRFYFLSAHYRSSLDYSEKIITQSEAAVKRLAEFVLRIKGSGTFMANINVPVANINVPDPFIIRIAEAEEKMIAEMDDDFNIPGATGHLYDLIRDVHKALDTDGITSESKVALNKLLIDFNSIVGYIPFSEKDIPEKIQSLATERETARKEKKYTVADHLRQQIQALGYDVDDTTYGPLIKKRL